MINSIYVVRYWEPFPNSEYGGQIVVVAQTRQQLKSLLRKRFDVTDEERFDDAVVNAKEIFPDMAPGIVAEFTT